MTIDVSGYMFALIAIGLSFVATKSSYFLLKFMAGVSWCIVALFWIGYSPTGITKGSPADTVIVIALFFIGIAFMLMPLWFQKSSNGVEVGRWKLPFSPTDEEEEEERQRRTLPTRQERVDRYITRLESAKRGERRRR